MAEIIDMPKLSDTMSVGTLVKWNIKEGQKVAFGDILAEVETDKATMELSCTVPGTVLKIYAPAGSQLPVGDPICAIGKAGEAAPDPKGKPVAPKAAAAAAPAPIPETTGIPCIPAAPVASAAPAPQSDASRTSASPYARRMAEKAALNVAALAGTGPGGRVVARDVAAAAAAPVSTAPAGPVNVAVAPPADGKGIQPDADVPVGGMRATIARRLLESKNTVPHFYLEVEVDAAPLMGLRETLNKRLAEQGGETALKLSVNDFILKASAEALRRVPAVNASWAGTSIRQHSAVHLSFGVALEDGLVTPVIRDAHAKSLRDIATDAKALIGKARSKKLSPAEMSGSTFTVTNLGMYGVTGFFGIINVPNAAILSVGATIKKPVIDANDRIVMGHRMVIGLSGDHRVVDGANGAQFLQALKQILEEPTLILI
ncbi:MAG: dihydrolipoamide acetyltransferase [Opitutia bacterium AMD-G3]|nr:MAG: dihydrolipoamide acetyltransferase [Opitutae bacterium AMD-G3]